MEDRFSQQREDGTPDEAIRDELSSPQAERNAQMKESACRKSPWRFLFAALAAYGAAELLGALSGWILYLVMRGQILQSEAASIGIIGGADGPTAIFITTPGWTGYVLPVLLLVVGIWGFFRLSKCRQK